MAAKDFDQFKPSETLDLVETQLDNNDEKYNKKVLKISDWTLWKAAYIPLSRIKPNVVQLERIEQEIELPGRVRLVRA